MFSIGMGTSNGVLGNDSSDQSLKTKIATFSPNFKTFYIDKNCQKWPNILILLNMTLQSSEIKTVQWCKME